MDSTSSGVRRWGQPARSAPAPAVAGAMLPAAARWQNHYSAFISQDVELTLEDYADLSMITVYNHVSGKTSVFRGLAGVRKCYTELFRSLSDRSDFTPLLQTVNEASNGTPGNICFVWHCSVSGFHQVSETHFLDASSKIFCQNIVISFRHPNGSSPAYSNRDSESPSGCGVVHDGWSNYSTALRSQDVNRMLQLYTDSSEILIFNHTDGSNSTFNGLDGARRFFDHFFLSLYDCTDFSLPIVHVEESKDGAPGEVFSIWSAPASGYTTATDTLMFSNAGRILRHNIVVSYVDPRKHVAPTSPDASTIVDSDAMRIDAAEHVPAEGNPCASSESNAQSAAASSSAQAPTSVASEFANLSELLEEHILDHSEYISAIRGAEDHPPELQVDSMFDSWNNFVQALTALGFDLPNGCPWRALGLGKDAGPEPSLDMIEQRARMARTLLSACPFFPWSSLHSRDIANFELHINNSCALCSQELQALLRSRRRLRRHDWPRWLELDGSFVEVCEQRCMDFSGSGLILTQLSNVQGLDLSSPFVASPERCRSLLSSLTGDAQKCAATMGDIASGTVIMWAPADRDALQRVLHGFMRFTSTAQAHDPAGFKLILLIPHAVYPGCKTAEDLLDLRWHPILENKWESIRKKLEFAKQPARCVFSGSAGPMYQSKSLLMVTLQATVSPSPPLIFDWKPSLLTAGDEAFLIVDCPSEQLISSQRALKLAELPGIISWEGPLSSPGSNLASKRVIFRGYVSPASATALGFQLLLSSLREISHLSRCLLGSSSLFTEPSALITDMGNARALEDFSHMMESAVLLSPTRALLIPKGEKSRWEVGLTEAQKRLPADCITKICWRASRQHGRTWAKPLALDSTVRSARIRANARSGPSSSAETLRSSALLILRGPVGADPDGLMQALMAALASKVEFPLARGDPTRALQPNQWLEVRDGGGTWTGSVRMQLATEDEVAVLLEIVRNSVVEIHGESRMLDMQNAFVSDDQAQREAAGAGRERRRERGRLGRPRSSNLASQDSVNLATAEKATVFARRPGQRWSFPVNLGPSPAAYFNYPVFLLFFRSSSCFPCIVVVFASQVSYPPLVFFFSAMCACSLQLTSSLRSAASCSAAPWS